MKYLLAILALTTWSQLFAQEKPCDKCWTIIPDGSIKCPTYETLPIRYTPWRTIDTLVKPVKAVHRSWAVGDWEKEPGESMVTLEYSWCPKPPRPVTWSQKRICRNTTIVQIRYKYLEYKIIPPVKTEFEKVMDSVKDASWRADRDTVLQNDVNLHDRRRFSYTIDTTSMITLDTTLISSGLSSPENKLEKAYADLLELYLGSFEDRIVCMALTEYFQSIMFHVEPSGKIRNRKAFKKKVKTWYQVIGELNKPKNEPFPNL